MSIDQTTVTDQDKLINVNYEGKKKIRLMEIMKLIINCKAYNIFKNNKNQIIYL